MAVEDEDRWVMVLDAVRARVRRACSLRYRRLAGALSVQEVRVSPRTDDPHGARRLAERARRHLTKGELDEAWVLLAASRRASLEGLDEAHRDAETTVIAAEVERKLTSWRRDAADELLGLDGPPPAALLTVVRLLDDRHDQHHARVRLASTQVTVLLSILGAVGALLIVLSATGAVDLFDARPLQAGQGRYAPAVVAAFGMLGAVLSTLLPGKAVLSVRTMPEELLAVRLAIARPFVGAAAALVLLVAATSGLTAVLTPSLPGLAMLAVAAGFSERLVTTVVGRVAAADAPADTDAVATRGAGA